jgi:hypothetical protein
MENGFHLERGVLSEETLNKGIKNVSKALDRAESSSQSACSSTLLYDCLEADEHQLFGSAKVRSMLDRLAGVDRWTWISGSNWHILFPGFAEAPWHVREMSWHIEGRWFQHFIDSPEIAAVVILFFSQVNDGDGGTAVVPGSHLVAAEILKQHPEGLSQFQITDKVRAVVSDCPVLEIHAQPGDALILHPFLIHASSVNIGTSTRIAASIRASFLHRPRIESIETQDLPPIEELIVRGLRRLAQARHASS